MTNMIGIKETNTGTTTEVVPPTLEQVQAMMQGIPLGDGPISGVAKGTPERNCIKQELFEKNGQQYVRYYHVTKGWRVRKVTGYSTIGGHKDWSGFHNLIARAQKAKIAADKANA